MTHRRSYHAYLLRLWEAGDGQWPEWRASLESVQGGERRGFASLAALFAFLEELSRPPVLPEEGHDETLPQ